MPPQPEVLENQTLDQKKIAFVQSGFADVVVVLLREASAHNPLVGATEFATVVNAVTLDAQSQLILDFITQLDAIKNGSLHERKTQ